jgi:uncharacterized protein YjdB
LSGTFTDISSTGTVIAPGTSGITGWTPLGGYIIDLTNGSIPIGFTFNFCGTNYTQLSACNHLWLSFTNSSSVNFYNWPAGIPTTSGVAGFLMLYWDDICGSGSNDYFQTTGTAPNRIFTLQYTNAIFWGSTWGGWWGCPGYATMQVKLYESTNVIEYWYGPNTWTYYPTTTYPGGATIGIANSTTDYKTVDAGFATATYGSFYSTHTLLPADGSILRWSTCTVTATPSTSGAVCPAGTVSLTATTSGTGWSWSGPSGFTSTLLSPTISPTVSGAYVFSAWGPAVGGGTCTTTATTMVTVNPLPPAPTLTPSVTTICNGGSVALTSSAACTWSPVTDLFMDAAFTIPYTGASASTVYVHPTTIASTTVLTYTATVTSSFGCTSSSVATVTVNVATAPITGSLSVCNGYNTTLSSSPPGGTWSSLSPGIGTVDAATGVVSGLAIGTTSILYTVAGCSSAVVVTVTPSPSAIVGINVACLGATTTLTSTPAGGTWSSSNPATGSVGSATGIVYGASVGTCTITYDMGGGCYVTRTVSVNPFPSAISGSGSVCIGTCTVLSSTPTGGIWTASSTPPGVATVTAAGPTAGTVCGAALGTSTIRYQAASCAVTTVVTVVTAATPPVGPASVCVGSIASYTTTASGGTWSSSTPAVGTIDPSTGVLTGIATGTTTITYGLSAGCISTLVVTVTPAPAAIVGASSVCQGLTTTLSHPVAGGTWSSSTPAIGSVGFATGIAGGVSATPAPGTTTITYTTPSSCIATMTFSVLPLPSAITGTMTLCQSQTATLGSATPGGTWLSSTPAVATVDAAGSWTALAVGTSTITYTSSAGCTTTATVTVNGIPAAISGPSAVCAAQNITLTDATPGGAWSSSAPAVGTISGTGSVYGVSAGTTVITYALPSGCYVTKVETVNPGPAALTGSPGLCVGLTTTLASTTGGGTWTSTAPTVASILSPGLIGGVSAGTATISYTLGATGCAATVVVTVNALPGAITGLSSVCVGQSTTLINSSAGGTWAVSTPATGTIDATTGTFTGIAAGTCLVSYSLGSGCVTTTIMTINALPGAIAGTLSICQGVTTTLSSSPVGGTWQSDATGIVSIGAGTGISTGSGAGTANISYTLPGGCRRTVVMTVNALPTVITGSSSVCVGQCITLTSGAGGLWSSSAPAVGTIGSSTGTFCGVSAGTSTISYTLPTGCYRTFVVLVNALPGTIIPSGAGLQVCEGSAINLTGSPVGGTWASSNPANGSISAGGGVLSGILAGTTTISYTITGGCYITSTATVNALPAAIGGPLAVCVGQTTTLTCTPAAGTWSISAGTGSATVGVATGIVTGGTSGTATVTYTLSTGCRKTAIVTINALPGLITGGVNVCEAATTTLNCTPAGGTWSTTCAFATIGVTTGVLSGISAGTCNVTYTAGAGCYSTRSVTVNSLPSPIAGTFSTCVGQTTALSGSPSGGTWSNSPLSLGTINSSSGLFYGLSAGTPVCTYTLPVTGCYVTQAVTVYALPSAIAGPLNVCENATTTLTTSTPGGTWLSTNTAVGSINSTTGVLSGIAAGTTNITYTLGTGCYSAAVASVNPAPAPVAGVLQVCIGATTTLSDATPLGVWSSGGGTGIAGVSSSGVVTGVTAGTVSISYTLGTGCAAIGVVSVYPLPTLITGPAEVCVNADITLVSTPGGGFWTSSSPANATVNPVTGVVTGVAATAPGSVTISYTQGIGCVRTTNIIVNPEPAPVIGNLNVCIGLTQLLSTASTGGTWSSSNPTVAPVSPSGLVSGSSLGTADISYTLPVTGCSRTVQATVQPLPSTITGASGFCNLSSTTYLSSPAGGTWASADTNILVIDPLTGVATGRDTFSVDIVYTLSTGCTTTKNVHLIVAPYPITGTHDMCFGQTRTLSNFISGGVWSSSSASVATVDPATGVVTGVNYGTATITYVLSSGCFSIYDVTVNPVPTPSTGPLQVCENYTAMYSNATPGGTWSSSLPSLGTIDVSTGLLGGIAPGAITITYTLISGCNSMKDVTVNALPGAIAGTFQVCEGSATLLTTASSGGLWGSADPGVAFVDPATGLMTGMSATTPGVSGIGQTVVSYTLPTGCYRAENVTVNPLPSMIVGATDVCENDVTVYTNATPGGGWVSSVIAVGTIDGLTGVFGGISPGATIISYVQPTGCVATLPVTVHPNPAPISGSLSVCAGFATNLHSSPMGGVWSQDPMSMGYGTIHAAPGVVSGIVTGVIPVTYTLSSGCHVVNEVTVITLPAVISGSPTVCVNDSVVLTNPFAGGTWSSSVPSRASVDPVTGIVRGLSAGTTVITYAVGTGCFNVLTVSVNPLPLPITGPLQVCEGSAILLSSGPTPGGNWISDNTTVANAGYASGIVTGISAGVANISYVIGLTGCLRSVPVSVNPTPGPIIGNPNVCIGSSNTFTNSMSGGTWLSSNPTIATIDAATGVVTSVSIGTLIITYRVPATGCQATRVISVQPLPIVYNVTGGGSYCSGGNGVHIGLSGSQPGVSYVLYRGSGAVGYLAGSGFALDFGLLTAAGVYSVQATNVTSGCMKDMAGSATVIVNPLVTPAVTIVTAPHDSVCPGQSVTMTPVPVNGGVIPTYIWKVNGVSVGTASVYSYIPANGDLVTITMSSNAACLATLTATGTKVLTVLPNAMPVANVITTPNDTVCQFNPVTLMAAPTYGGPSPAYTWQVNGAAAGTGPTYSYIPVDGDVVSLKMVSDYRCRLANTVTSGDVALSVDSLLIPTVDVWVEPGLAVEAGKPVTLHATATNAGANPTFLWKVNGHPVPGATTGVFTAIFNDYDSISCMVISSGVCANIGTHDWVFITMLALTTGQPVTGSGDIRLIPNPNKGVFSINGTLASGADEDVNVEVANLLGQVVYRGTLKSIRGKVNGQVQLDNSLANGMYLLTLNTTTEQKVFHFVVTQ